MARRQADGTLVTVSLVAAALSRMPLSNIAAAILEAPTEFFWRVLVVVRSPRRWPVPNDGLWLLLALWLLLLALRLLLLTLRLLLWR